MSLSMYQASVPAFLQMLNNLSAVLDKAEAYAGNRKIDPEVLLNYRLTPDMFPFVRQSRLQPISPREPLRGSRVWKCRNMTTLRRPLPISRRGSLIRWHSWNPSNLATLTALKSGHYPNPWRHTMSFKGQPYLVHFVLPNFYFHCTTAYDILRHCGVELGKRDFIGAI